MPYGKWDVAWWTPSCRPSRLLFGTRRTAAAFSALPSGRGIVDWLPFENERGISSTRQQQSWTGTKLVFKTKPVSLYIVDAVYSIRRCNQWAMAYLLGRYSYTHKSLDSGSSHFVAVTREEVWRRTLNTKNIFWHRHFLYHRFFRLLGRRHHGCASLKSYWRDNIHQHIRNRERNL